MRVAPVVKMLDPTERRNLLGWVILEQIKVARVERREATVFALANKLQLNEVVAEFGATDEEIVQALRALHGASRIRLGELVEGYGRHRRSVAA